jgi:hypothetical protein
VGGNLNITDTPIYKKYLEKYEDIHKFDWQEIRKEIPGVIGSIIL